MRLPQASGLDRCGLYSQREGPVSCLVASLFPLGAMFVVGFAGMNCTPSNAGEWWEDSMRQVKKSTWLQGLDVEHQVFWPPMQEDGKAAWGRQDAHYHFHDVYLLMCVQVLAP